MSKITTFFKNHKSIKKVAGGAVGFATGVACVPVIVTASSLGSIYFLLKGLLGSPVQVDQSLADVIISLSLPVAGSVFSIFHIVEATRNGYKYDITAVFFKDKWYLLSKKQKNEAFHKFNIFKQYHTLVEGGIRTGQLNSTDNANVEIIEKVIADSTLDKDILRSLLMKSHNAIMKSEHLENCEKIIESRHTRWKTIQ